MDTGRAAGVPSESETPRVSPWWRPWSVIGLLALWATAIVLRVTLAPSDPAPPPDLREACRANAAWWANGGAAVHARALAEAERAMRERGEIAAVPEPPVWDCAKP